MLDQPTMESYLESIAEQVVDEDKIVTYKSLSRSLGVHVNTAKQLLYAYLTNEKSKNSFPISATYLVAGKMVDGSFNVTIVNEADLKDAKSTFIEITSEHVYSVQKGKSLKEVKVLCRLSKEQSNSENSKLVITCSKSELKSRGGVKKNVESHEKANKKILAKALLTEKKTVAAPEPIVKKVETTTTTTTSKESTSKSPKKTSPKGNQQKGQGNSQKPAGNIGNLFAKAAQKSAGKPATAAKSEQVRPKEEIEVVKAIEPEKKNRNLEEGSESKENLKRKKKGKKRKRVQMLSDSEESDSDDEEKIDVEEDEETPPCNINIEEEEREEVKEFVPRNKRKKRKVIDRTVMNEDGYLETKKEVVFETDSENEADEAKPAVKEPQKPSGKGAAATAAAAAKKQSSLLTFFKKS